MAGQCTVQLLGGFRVEVEGRLVPDRAWRHRRGAELVKLLALAQPHRIHRERVEDTLWPDLSREAAAANLRKAVYFARRALGREDAIELGAGMVALWPNGELVVDSERFEAAARVARAPGDGSAAAAALFGGDLLPEDRYAEWTEPHRERLREKYVELLKRTGRWEQILELDRSDEQAHQALMRQAVERGDRRAAIRQFTRLREVLRVDLGVGPSAETVTLYEQAIGMEGAETPAPEDRVRALIARALVSWSEQDLSKAELDAEQARQLADDYELGRELGEASTVLGLVAWARGNWPDRFRKVSMDVFRRTPDQAVSVFEGQLCLAEAALYSAESDAIGALARELLTTAESSGSICGQALMNLLIGETDLFSGRLAEARVRLSRAIELCRGLGSSTGQGLGLVRLAELALTSGRLDEARQLITTAMPLARQSELGDHLLVRAYAALIRSTAGRRRRMRVVEEAVHAYQNRRMCGPCSIGFWLVAATASIGAGDLARARTYLREAERQAGMWQGGPWLAATWEARAALRQAEGERTQAAALLREAEGLYAQSARPVDAARCRAAALAAGRQAIAINS